MSAIARRVTYLIATSIVVVAMILSIVSVSTDSWVTASANGITIEEGLWRVCVDQGQGRECVGFNEDLIASSIISIVLANFSLPW